MESAHEMVFGHVGASSTLVTAPDPWAFGRSAVGPRLTGVAALIAVTVWLDNGRRERRARAYGVAAHLRANEEGALLCAVNTAPVSACDVRVYPPEYQGEARRYAVLFPNEPMSEPGPDEPLPRLVYDDVELVIEFTKDGRRWVHSTGGKLRRDWWWLRRLRWRRIIRNAARLGGQ